MYLQALCPEGWRKSVQSTSCFKRHYHKSAWQESRNFCKSIGGDLATIPNAKVLSEISAMTTPGEEFWIGLNDVRTRGYFTWLDSAERVST
ncbi:macrophage mannose receptor 1 [Elysia marginata]|uniref:Macrophage mannose receptor 1 n=1 Tax=Elysia marginata TaxID=1093978 RepID=A0AAV4FUZ0_9GAST|nr:macrophage mannose receptor 1 [Elysia marginata]